MQQTSDWRCFSVLDLGAIYGSVGLGCLLCAGPGVGAFLAGAVFGLLLAGPLLLLVQFTIKGRRTWLSAGEGLWVLQASCFGLLGGIQAAEGRTRMDPFVLFFLAEMLISLVAFYYMALTLTDEARSVPCIWADRMGAWVSGGTGLLFCISVCAALAMMGGG